MRIIPCACPDNLSNGRAILSLGLGAVWMGWQAFPDYATDIRTRAELLDPLERSRRNLVAGIALGDRASEVVARVRQGPPRVS
jgi:hypothetical protein